MALKRKIVAHDRNVRAGEWNYKLVGPIYRLRNQTLGLVGFGRIGQRMAAKMREIIFDIQAYDPYLTDQVFAEAGVRRVSLEELFRTFRRDQPSSTGRQGYGPSDIHRVNRHHGAQAGNRQYEPRRTG